MVSDAVSSSHGRQEYGTAALAPEGLRGAYRKVAGRREAGPGRGGATPAGVRRSSPDRRAIGVGAVHGRAQERGVRGIDRRPDRQRGRVPQRGVRVHAALPRRGRAPLGAGIPLRSSAGDRSGAGYQAIPDQGPRGHDQHGPHRDDEGRSRVGGVGRDQDVELHRGCAQSQLSVLTGCASSPTVDRLQPFEATMGMRSGGLSALLVLLVVSACGGGRRSVLVPPRLDLQPYGRLGLVTFTVENAKGSLHEFATERFAEDLLAAQPGTEVLELGTQDSLLRRVGEKELGIAAAQELGKQREVGAVFAGHLKVTNPKGTGGLAGLVTPHLEATVRVDLTVRLLSTRSGATLWRSSAWATERVGHVALIGGQLDFSAKDPKEAYGPLVNTLIRLVTQDMRSTWTRQ